MATALKAFSKEELIDKLKAIYAMGWIPNKRGKNNGAVGNTLEDLLGIPENNLPIPNASEWELKSQRSSTSSLTTMFHSEPSPRAISIVPNILLPKYGWAHKQAGVIYPPDEKSFRVTLNAKSFNDRGFSILVNDRECRVEVAFNRQCVSVRHSEWLNNVCQSVGNIDNVFF